MTEQTYETHRRWHPLFHFFALPIPDDLRGRLGELRTAQLIALRFCSDEEAPEMVRAILAGEPARARHVEKWRADHMRV